MTDRPAYRGHDMQPENETTFRGLERKLRGEGRSEQTIAAYHQACLSFESFLRSAARDEDLLSATQDDVSDWLAALRKGGGWHIGTDGRPVQSGKPLAKDSVVSYFTSLRRFYNWALERELIEKSPMQGLETPKGSQRLRDFPSDAAIADILATCRPRGGKRTFNDIRDEFILRLFSEAGGPRCSELALLPMDKLDLRDDLIEVHGKGDKWRIIPLSPATAEAGQRYLRARKGHKWASRSDRVFLGLKGPMTSSGVYQMAVARSELAGHGKVHPHAYRHAVTHAAKARGMSDGDIMLLSGWSTATMLRRYGAKLAAERAVAAARAHHLGDRF